MTQWATFTGITGVVLVLLLVLSHLTQTAFSESTEDRKSRVESTDDRGSTAEPAAADTDDDRGSDSGFDLESPRESESRAETVDSSRSDEPADTDPSAAIDGDESITVDPASSRPADPSRSARSNREGIDPDSLSTGELLANVAFSQGLFALVLIGAVIYTGIPADALGIEYSLAYLESGLLLGTVFGLVLYVANEIGAATATHFGFDHDEQLRELLAPDSAQGWLVLFAVVLPIIAVFEELLFRAAMIGVVSAGFGIDPWLLAVVSSVAFALGHGMQGSVGIVVTGVLGFVLAAIYIVTGSLLVVVVAHYLINALEFAVHEGVGFDWAKTLES
ncbi:CPBP family glutamic-type intramembrane protease [Natronolimnohabitans sp. A-GB9]|uniref:CPBP family intramembrane glutamic endopeptidase n=1 Tax=Natronolimnohabitans sp. A-GB9 TaxID=3069757 RepID=UPI0027B203FF|nr:CPBP family glutamic-type intramembrane protease [Natronolimnohabitans sp. A-GB9]MDQ2049880.1 CPBP family glutamic-type intramembrane protease [Natronolimnohabitans sp. A-GB9]